MKRDFKNKNVLITGAAGNLGTELCFQFAEAGANIIAIDLKQEAIANLKSQLSEKAYSIMGFSCDITDKTALNNLIHKLRNDSKIDVLINNAGITHIKKFSDIEDPEPILRRVMEVNLFAAVNLTKYCMEDLISQKGLIINISSVAGFAPLLGRTAYSASKHALQGYFESLRTELFDQKVHIMTVCPSFIGADENRSTFDSNNENSVNQKKKLIGNALNPKHVASEIIKAASKNKSRVIIGNTAKKANIMFRLFPDIYEKMMAKKLKKGL